MKQQAIEKLDRLIEDMAFGTITRNELEAGLDQVKAEIEEIEEK